MSASVSQNAQVWLGHGDISNTQLLRPRQSPAQGTARPSACATDHQTDRGVSARVLPLRPARSPCWLTWEESKVSSPIIRSVACAILLLFVPLAKFAQAQDRCGEILKFGVFDYSGTSSDSANANAFVNWLSSSKQTHSGSSGSTHGNYMVEVFKGDLSAATEQAMSESAASYQRGDSGQITRLASFAKTPSPVIAKAWKDCMDSASFGLRVTQRVTSNPKLFYVVFQFRPSNPVQYPASTLSWVKTSTTNLCLRSRPNARRQDIDRVLSGAVPSNQELSRKRVILRVGRALQWRFTGLRLSCPFADRPSQARELWGDQCKSVQRCGKR